MDWFIATAQEAPHALVAGFCSLFHRPVRCGPSRSAHAVCALGDPEAGWDQDPYPKGPCSP